MRHIVIAWMNFTVQQSHSDDYPRTDYGYSPGLIQRQVHGTTGIEKCRNFEKVIEITYRLGDEN